VKILLVSSISIYRVSGSARLLRDIVESLPTYGHSVDVLTYGVDHKSSHVEGQALRKNNVYLIPAQRIQGLSSLIMLGRLIALLKFRRYDLVLCGVAFPTAILALIAHFLTGCPYAIYSHGEDVTEVEGSVTKSVMLARALYRASAIMANSHFTCHQITTLNVSANRVTYTPPWIDPALYQEVSSASVESLRAQLGLQGKRVILTLARLDPRKGHDTVIRTLHALRTDIPNLHYLIVGYGDQQSLRSLAQSEGVSDMITFVEYLVDKDLPVLFHLCDVYAMVSRWDGATRQVEGFGITYLEAAAAGKPSVAGAAGGAIDAVEDGKTGFVVDPTSVDATRDALYKLLIDPSEATAMGIFGREMVWAQFEKEKSMRRMAQLLETCVRL